MGALSCFDLLGQSHGDQLRCDLLGCGALQTWRSGDVAVLALLADNAFFAYGHYEGIPRVLDLMDKHGIKLSSFMIGKAVETSPDLAQEIVRRGHEAAAHGRVWDNSYQLPRDEEKRFIADSVETIHKVTGQQPVGWNAYWMRNSIYILETLQDLGFLYHIDEPSHDEPFIVPVGPARPSRSDPG